MAGRDRLAVILTTWRKLSRLENTLKQLKSQTFKDFDLFIWNNNRDPGKPELVDATASSFATQAQPITAIHSYDNFQGRGRHLLARHIRLRHGYRYVCFLEDDMVLANGQLERLWAEKQPTSIVSPRVYAASSPAVWPKQDAHPGQFGFFGTAAGAIIDTELFAYDQYWALWPQRYWPLDDHWMCAMARAMSWNIVRSSTRLEIATQHKQLRNEPRYKALLEEFQGLYTKPQAGRYGVGLYQGPLP